MLEYIEEQLPRLVRMIFDTSVTEQQKMVKDFIEKVFIVLSNLFFVCIVTIFVVYLLVSNKSRFTGVHRFFVNHHLKDLYPQGPVLLLIIFALILLILTSLLPLFQFVRFAELTKLYVFMELVYVTIQYFNNPRRDGLSPLLFTALEKLLNHH